MLSATLQNNKGGNKHVLSPYKALRTVSSIKVCKILLYKYMWSTLHSSFRSWTWSQRKSHYLIHFHSFEFYRTQRRPLAWTEGEDFFFLSLHTYAIDSLRYSFFWHIFWLQKAFKKLIESSLGRKLLFLSFGGEQKGMTTFYFPCEWRCVKQNGFAWNTKQPHQNWRFLCFREFHKTWNFSWWAEREWERQRKE